MGVRVLRSWRAIILSFLLVLGVVCLLAFGGFFSFLVGSIPEREMRGWIRLNVPLGVREYKSRLEGIVKLRRDRETER